MKDNYFLFLILVSFSCVKLFCSLQNPQNLTSFTLLSRSCSNSTNQLHCLDHFKQRKPFSRLSSPSSLHALSLQHLTTFYSELHFLMCIHLSSSTRVQAPCCVPYTRQMLSRHLLNAWMRLTVSWPYKLQNTQGWDCFPENLISQIFTSIDHNSPTYLLLVCLFTEPWNLDWSVYSLQLE